MDRSEGGFFMSTLKNLVSVILWMLSLLLVTPTQTSAITKSDKHRGRAPNRSLKQGEVKEAEARLSEMGYGTGRVDGVFDAVTRNALIAFQKYEGRDVTGRPSRENVDAIMSANAPPPRDSGYRHVEVDLDRQVLLLTDGSGVVERVLPVSTGSEKHYH